MSKTEEATGAEIALIDQAIVISPEVTQQQLEQVRDVLSGAAEYELPDADVSAVTAEILNRLLFAKDEEELNAEVVTWSSKDCVGRSFRVFPAGRLWPSNFLNKETGRKGAFLSMQAMDADSGEVGVLNTSSPYIAAKVIWYARNGQLPAVFQIVVRGTSSGGFDILDVEKQD